MSNSFDKHQTKAAGGWGALKSSAKHLIQSENALTGVKALLRANQPGGFDCPGCAWGDEADAKRIDFCENGLKAIAWEATAKRVDRDFFARHSLSELRRWDDHTLEKQGRLTEPMWYDGDRDHYQPVTWETAYALIAKALKQLDDPDQLLLYTSGRASNEAAYLYQLFGRAFGTNNFPDCSNMCHEASGVGLTRSIGTGKGTVTLEDFAAADAIFLFGQNPGTNHPRMLATLRHAAERGTKIVAVNTLKERGLQRFADPQSPTEMLIASSKPISHFYYTPRLGGDMACLRGIAKQLLAWSAQDQAFIDEHCTGFAAYQAEVENTSWEHIVQQSGLQQEEIRQMADLYASCERVIFTWAMGITQHTHSVATVQELTNVLLLRGNIGKPGAGACPVRGHSNVQGNRTVGINERPAQAFLQALDNRYGFVTPKHAGLNTVESIRAMLEGKARVFIGLGGNFAAATPDTARTYQALGQCQLTVHVSTKLNRSHVVTGRQALILPCLGRTEVDLQASGEQCVTVEDSMSMVHSSRGQNPPASAQLKSEPAIVAGIAQVAALPVDIDWQALADDYQLIRDEIAAVIPGFECYNERVAAGRGFYLTNPAAQRVWQTPSAKACFSAAPLPEADKQPTHWQGQRVLTLQTLRSHDQYNTTIYGLDDRYRGVKGERRVLFINPSDLQALGLEEGQRVSITSVADDGLERSVQDFKLRSYDIPAGCVAAYYPETNPLVPLERVAKDCGTPTYKSIPIVLFPDT